MRLNRGAVPASLALLYLTSSVIAAPPPQPAGVDKLAKETTPSASKPTKGTIGRPDAPVDGKDGRPHAGPWVETDAERSRKKSPGKAEPKPKPKAEGTEKLPESNDGVMDDRNRSGPKEGTRGTEGGISEKSRDKQDSVEEGQKPAPPKEAPTLPPSEEQKITPVETPKAKPTNEAEDDKVKGSKKKDDEEEIVGEIGGLNKPELPDKTHDIPHPVPVGSAEKDPLAIKNPSTIGDSTPDATGIIRPLHSFFLAFTMIIFSEIGDKTFLVAALMAMKHPPVLVFTAAFSALAVMTLLSAVLGHAVPALLSVRVTNFLAAILFLVFGAKMLREGFAISPDEGVGEEMREVEMELEEKEQAARKMRRRSDLSPQLLEAGRGSRKARSSTRLPEPPESPPSSPDSRSPSPSRVSSVRDALAGINNLCSLLLSPAWVQTFVMTFLGEWGDRSQIATIAMSAGADYWFVAMGSLVGHSICTAGAVIGGRAIAGRVSLRIVTLGGAFAFLAFGLIYLAEAFYYK